MERNATKKQTGVHKECNTDVIDYIIQHIINLSIAKEQPLEEAGESFFLEFEKCLCKK